MMKSSLKDYLQILTIHDKVIFKIIADNTKRILVGEADYHLIRGLWVADEELLYQPG